MGANIGFERALEYEPDAIGGQIFWEQFVEPAEADAVRRLIEDVVGGGAPTEHDNTWLASSGRRLTIAWTCTPLPDLDERKLFLLTGVDVTERQLRAAQVRDGEERLRTVIERAPVAIVEVGLDDLVKLWNPAAERIFGWSPEEVLGRPVPTVAPGLEADFRSILTEIRGGRPHEALETVGLCKDGSLVDVEISAAPIRDAAGAVAGHIAVFTDVSERKRYNEELRASRSRIVEAGDEARRQLERNLHDGAQQRLVALSVSMRLAESKLATDPVVAAEILAGARDELTQALGDLRELARGIHPAVLTDRGLAPAIEALWHAALFLSRPTCSRDGCRRPWKRPRTTSLRRRSRTSRSTQMRRRRAFRSTARTVASSWR